VAQKYIVALGDEAEVTFELEREGAATRVRRDGDESWHACELERVGDSDLYVLMIDSRPTELYIERRHDGPTVTIGRHIFPATVSPWRPGGRRASGGQAPKGVVRIVAPMTGGIVEVRCREGEAVSRGQVLLVIESMKMNNEIRSPAAGLVETVPLVAGQKVQANELLVAIRTGPA
jgi:biotin carboxyl carrier protein